MKDMLSAYSLEAAFKNVNNLAQVYIGYSGGVDSHVLLHLCSLIPHLKNKITAVYVHHGLQGEADAWAEHCQKTALALGVGFKVLLVNASPRHGESPEETARNARYDALKLLINVGDVLVVGQHRDDQLETVLLQLFRGCGLSGLSAMPESSVFGDGLMLRPLLNTSKAAINDYALANALSWVNDPSNLSSDYDRNFLRNEVLPLLKKRWPACDKTVARSAKHCADAQTLISAQAESLFLDIFNVEDKTLGINNLKQLTINEQALVIRQWFQVYKLKMPAQAFIERLQAEVISARKDADPILTGQGCCVRRYRDKLYCLSPVLPIIMPEALWPVEDASIKISPDQILCREASSAGLSLARWQTSIVTVRTRKGGESIRLQGRNGHHDLKKLYQEAGIPPWERQRIPLIYLDDELVAVGDLWISADFYSEIDQGCINFQVQKEFI